MMLHRTVGTTRLAKESCEELDELGVPHCKDNREDLQFPIRFIVVDDRILIQYQDDCEGLKRVEVPKQVIRTYLFSQPAIRGTSVPATLSLRNMFKTRFSIQILP
jgi:hypothetical protein